MAMQLSMENVKDQALTMVVCNGMEIHALSAPKDGTLIIQVFVNLWMINALHGTLMEIVCPAMEDMF